MSTIAVNNEEEPVFVRDSAVTAVIHKSDGEEGYWCHIPVIPGCYSQGDTWEEACWMIADALEGLLTPTCEELKSGSADFLANIEDPRLKEAVLEGKPIFLFFAFQDDREYKTIQILGSEESA